MDVAVSIQEHVIWLHVTVNDALAVDIAQGASQLGDPEPHGLLCECFAGNMKSQVAAAHQVDNEVHILNVLEAVSQVANERVVNVFEHATFANDVADAFGPDDWREKGRNTVSTWRSSGRIECAQQ